MGIDLPKRAQRNAVCIVGGGVIGLFRSPTASARNSARARSCCSACSANKLTSGTTYGTPRRGSSGAQLRAALHEPDAAGALHRRAVSRARGGDWTSDRLPSVRLWRLSLATTKDRLERTESAMPSMAKVFNTCPINVVSPEADSLPVPARQSREMSFGGVHQPSDGMPAESRSTSYASRSPQRVRAAPRQCGSFRTSKVMAIPLLTTATARERRHCRVPGRLDADTVVFVRGGLWTRYFTARYQRDNTVLAAACPPPEHCPACSSQGCCRA